MNLLQNIFLEYFQDRYYFSDMGRAYVEYICEKSGGFSGKICFFHFSLSTPRLNAYHNAEILKFIKLFYSHACIQVFPLIKYAIDHNIVMSINSLNEYEFVLKIWNENETVRRLLERFIQKNTGIEYRIENNENIRFIELLISCQGVFSLKNIKIYSEEVSRENIPFSPGFLDEQNIAMVLSVHMKEFIHA